MPEYITTIDAPLGVVLATVTVAKQLGCPDICEAIH